jgi:hypothetical protein
LLLSLSLQPVARWAIKTINSEETNGRLKE